MSETDSNHFKLDFPTLLCAVNSISVDSFHSTFILSSNNHCTPTLYYIRVCVILTRTSV